MKTLSLFSLILAVGIALAPSLYGYYDVRTIPGRVAESSNARQLLEDARAGDVDAMRQLGKHLIDGTVMKRDLKNGVLWLKKAVEAGDDRSMVLLGDLYCHGRGVSKSEKKAVELYMQAAEAGNKNAVKRLEKLPLKSAVSWWESRAEDGDKKAVLKLMRAYATGKGLPKDMEKAREYYEIAVREWPEDTKKILSKLTEEQRTALVLPPPPAKPEPIVQTPTKPIAQEEDVSNRRDEKEESWKNGVPQPTIDLRLAAKKNEHWKYEDLIKKGADVNYCFSDGYRVIDFEMGAIGEGIDILLKYGADVNSSWPSYCESISNRNRNEFYSEYELMDEKSIIAADEFMYYLLKKGVKFEPDEKGNLPLHYAAINGWPLYAKHASGTGVINKQNKYGMTALAVVVNMLEEMIRHRRHMESPTTQYMGARPIYNSAREKRLVEVLVILLQNGANPNIAAEKDSEGQINTPFTFLLRHWFDSEDIGAMVKALYNNGADPNTEVENGYTILDFLVLDSSVSKDGRLYIHREAIKFLVERGGKCRNREALSKLKNDPELGQM